MGVIANYEERREAYLQHFGVKGMRWGVRRSKKETPEKSDSSKKETSKKETSKKETSKKKESLTKRILNDPDAVKIAVVALGSAALAGHDILSKPHFKRAMQVQYSSAKRDFAKTILNGAKKAGEIHRSRNANARRDGSYKIYSGRPKPSRTSKRRGAPPYSGGKDVELFLPWIK
jgi:hypothetical protein